MTQQSVPSVPVRLLADRVLVKVDKVEERKTAGGIIIPQTNAPDMEQARTGTVLRVSPRVATDTNEADRINIGDRIIFSKFAGSDLLWEHEEYKVMRITDIFGVIEE